MTTMTVSILTRPEGRVQPGRGCVGAESSVVSILTRPEGRVQPNLLPNINLGRFIVSILTRPEGRVQL